MNSNFYMMNNVNARTHILHCAPVYVPPMLHYTTSKTTTTTTTPPTVAPKFTCCFNIRADIRINNRIINPCQIMKRHKM